MSDGPDSLTGDATRILAVVIVLAAGLAGVTGGITPAVCFSAIGGAIPLYLLGEIVCLLKVISHKLGSGVKPAQPLHDEPAKTSTKQERRPSTYNLD